jgi:hemerythrin-like metal-binding protein
MEALTWNSKYLTGIAVVDVQHERLVALVNAFGELNARDAEVPARELEAVVDELTDYAHTHFVDEERLMRDAKLDARFLGAHATQHHRFLRELHHLRSSRFLDGQEDASRVLLRFLLHWLAFHILGIDMQMARQMYRVHLGASASDAFEAEVEPVGEGDSNKLLLAAVDDLLRVVAERNLTLSEANRTLEQRVAERTSELEASNARLQAIVETLRATQARLLESEKLASVGQLASGLAHEINNPLGFVSSNVSSMGGHLDALVRLVDTYQAHEPALGPEARQAVQQATQDADYAFVRGDAPSLLQETKEGLKRVEAIVRDLKDFARVDDGSLTEADLNQCLEATLRMLPPAKRQGVSVVARPGELPSLRCYGAQVNQALMSLVVNAIQAVVDRPDHAGEVSLTTGVDGEAAYVEVRDDGVGMSPEVLAHAFEPFFTTRPVGEGVGLGLWTAWSCAERHGGRLEAHSALGVGSTFRLSLPIGGPPAPAEGAGTGAATGPKPFDA